VGWTIAALAAIEDPHDPVALVGALRSPFFGVTDEMLLGLHVAGGEFCYLRPLPAGADPALARAWALLGELHRDRNAAAPAAVVERLLAGSEALAAYALEPQGEARVANLLKVLDTARALEKTGALSFRGLVRWLRDRGASRYEEEESAVDADDAVRLMTIHKAKGLEFPVVVVPDLGRAGPWRAPIILADRASARLAMNLGRVADTTMTTLDWADAEAREIQRVDAEALRVLYVALTRAERALVLPVPSQPEGNGFYQHLLALLGAPTDVLAAEEFGRPAPVAADAPAGSGPGETLEAWRARHRALIARGGVRRRVAWRRRARGPTVPRGGAPARRRGGAGARGARRAGSWPTAGRSCGRRRARRSSRRPAGGRGRGGASARGGAGGPVIARAGGRSGSGATCRSRSRSPAASRRTRSTSSSRSRASSSS
jgi:hypothetical protein